MFKLSIVFNKILFNAFALTIADIITKLLYFFIIILVARKIGPNYFGEYNTALNYIALFSIFTMLGFDVVVVREGAKNINNVEKLQNEMFPLRFWISIIIFLVSLISLSFFNYSNNISRLICLLSIVIIFGGQINSGLSEHFGSTLRIYEKFLWLGIARITRVSFLLICTGFLVMFDYFSIQNFSIVVSISSILYLIILYTYSNKLIQNKFSININFSYLKPYIFPIVMFAIVSVLTMYATIIDIQILNKYHGTNSVGIYAVSLNFVNVGFMAIGALQLALYPHSSRNIMTDNYTIKLLKYYTIIFFIICIIIVISINLIPLFVKIIFGDKYSDSISSLKILVWVIPFKLLISWANQVLESMNKYLIKISISIIFLFLVIILNYSLVPKLGAKGSAISFLLSNIIITVIAFFVTLFINKKLFLSKNE